MTGESYGKSFADSPASARDQDALISYIAQLLRIPQLDYPTKAHAESGGLRCESFMIKVDVKGVSSLWPKYWSKTAKRLKVRCADSNARSNRKTSSKRSSGIRSI